MGAWAIVGIVFAALALALAALCCVPGRLLILYDAQDGFRLRGSVLWLKFGERKPEPEAEPKKPQKKAQKDAPPKAAEKHAKATFKTVTEHAGELADLLGKLLRQLGVLVRSVVVKELRLLCAVSLDDPDAAVRYGKICAALFPALGALHETLRVNERNEQVDISCVCGGEDRIEFRMLLQLRAVHVLRTLLPLTPPALRLLKDLRPDEEAASRKRPSKA